MPILQISRAAAESIVESGTRNLYVNYQYLPDCPRGQTLLPPFGHRVCTTSTDISGSSQTTNVTIDGSTVAVRCPLLRDAIGTQGQEGFIPAETISQGTKVIVSWNDAAGEWQIIEAQCPLES